jgi:metallo-beta-lactamase family protein
VRVRARIAHVNGLSAHADFSEILSWLERGPLSPKGVFVTHGEPAAADAMRRRVRERFGWEVSAPEQGASFSL